jgi:DNA polymerase-3 subunit delta
VNLRTGDLAAALERPLAPLWVVYGDELLAQEASDAIRAAARRQGFDERETLVVNKSFRWNELTLAAGNLSLFGGNKLIDLRIPTGKPGRDGGEALQRYATAPPSGVFTLISLPMLDWQAKKTTWFKTLAAAATTLEFIAPDLAHLPAWIAQRLAAQKQSASADALEFIAHHVEGNLLAAHQEIRKLGLLHGEGELSLADVETAVLNVARYNISMLREALLASDPARCARLLDGLRGESVAPPLVLWAFTTEIRTLIRLRAAIDHGQPLSALFKAERIADPTRQRMMRDTLNRLSLPQLHTALRHAARIDRIIKGIASGEAWDEFLALALRVTGKGK